MVLGSIFWFLVATGLLVTFHEFGHFWVARRCGVKVLRFSIGLGKFRNFPNQSLVAASVTDAKLGNAGIGARYHVSERLVLRVDYTIYTAFVADTRSTEYRAVTAGLSFFF